MTFWQENYSFIKEVYDTRSTMMILITIQAYIKCVLDRYSKMVEWMDHLEMAISKVIYIIVVKYKINGTFILMKLWQTDLYLTIST